MTKNIKSLLAKKFPGSIDCEVLKEVNYLDSGIPTMNYIISGLPFSGGIPSNRFVTLYGPDGSGKTSYAFQLMKKALEHTSIDDKGKEYKDFDVVFLDTECGNDVGKRLLTFGIDVTDDDYKDRFTWAAPDTIEELFEMVELVCNDRIKDNNKKPILFVWDSIAGSATKYVSSRTYDDKEIGDRAGVLTRALQKLKPIFHKTSNAYFVMLNQARVNIGGFGDIFVQPCGACLKHEGCVNIRVNKIKPNEEYQGVKMSTVKNKLFTPFLSTTVNFSYNNGFTKEYIRTAFAEFLKEIGMIGQSGSWCFYSDEMKKIILDNGFNKKIVSVSIPKTTIEKNEEIGEEEKKTVYEIVDKEEILFDVEAKFYLKNFTEQIINDNNFYNTVLKISENFVQKNLNKINEKMKDETAIEDDNGKTIGVKKPIEKEIDPAEQMFDDMKGLDK